MNRKMKEVFSRIDEKNATARMYGDNGYFEPVELVMPKAIKLPCSHCRRSHRIKNLTMFSNSGMMADAPLSSAEISLIVTCPVCGNRRAVSRNTVYKCMTAGQRIVKTLLVLLIVLAVALAGVSVALRFIQQEKLYMSGSAAYDAGDYATAVVDLTKSSEYGNAEAIYLLSQCYRNGTGVKKDLKKADEMLDTAIQKGSELARYDIGKEDFEKYITEGDETALSECIENYKASENPEAKYQLSILTRAGVGVSADESAADELLKSAAEKGSIGALCDTAQKMIYNQDPAGALKLLKDSKVADDPEILAAQGYATLFAEGAEPGMALLQEARDKGSVRARYYDGLIAYNGLITGERDQEAATAAFQEASDAGDLRARYELSLCLAGTKDDSEAKALALELAQECYDRGYLEAGCTLCYYTDDQDRKVDLASVASDWGYAPASIWMGWYYSNSDSDLCRAYLQSAYNQGAMHEANIAMQNYHLASEGDVFGPSYIA